MRRVHRQKVFVRRKEAEKFSFGGKKKSRKNGIPDRGMISFVILMRGNLNSILKLCKRAWVECDVDKLCKGLIVKTVVGSWMSAHEKSFLPVGRSDPP